MTCLIVHNAEISSSPKQKWKQGGRTIFENSPRVSILVGTVFGFALFLRSLKNLECLINSLVAKLIAMYSASYEGKATHACFLDREFTAPSATKKIYLLVDFKSSYSLHNQSQNKPYGQLVLNHHTIFDDS